MEEKNSRSKDEGTVLGCFFCVRVEVTKDDEKSRRGEEDEQGAKISNEESY